jgi:nucleoid-associated protein YgaU
MSVRAKYQAVLDLGMQLQVKNGDVQEKDGKLVIKGQTATQHEKNLIWDKIKSIGGENPSDIVADIAVANTQYLHKHTVKSGETLSAISKIYYKDGNKYMKIFEANKNILKNPDTIMPGQELIIPNP